MANPWDIDWENLNLGAGGTGGGGIADWLGPLAAIFGGLGKAGASITGGRRSLAEAKQLGMAQRIAAGRAYGLLAQRTGAVRAAAGAQGTTLGGSVKVVEESVRQQSDAEARLERWRFALAQSSRRMEAKDLFTQVPGQIGAGLIDAYGIWKKRQPTTTTTTPKTNGSTMMNQNPWDIDWGSP